MKYRVSRVDKGHYECYYQGRILSIYKVDPSMVFLDEKGNKQLWMCRIDEKCTPVWADTKKKVIKKAINTMKQTLIAIALLTLVSCQDDDATPQGTAYEMAGTWNVVVQDFYNNQTRYCTVQLNPISANRSLMVYGGCNGTSSTFNYPNDTIDFASNGTLTIGRDTFIFSTSSIIHYATGTYTENSILFPNYKYFEIQGNNQNVYTYGYQLTR